MGFSEELVDLLNQCSYENGATSGSGLVGCIFAFAATSIGNAIVVSVFASLAFYVAHWLIDVVKEEAEDNNWGGPVLLVLGLLVQLNTCAYRGRGNTSGSGILGCTVAIIKDAPGTLSVLVIMATVAAAAYYYITTDDDDDTRIQTRQRTTFTPRRYPIRNNVQESESESESSSEDEVPAPRAVVPQKRPITSTPVNRTTTMNHSNPSETRTNATNRPTSTPSASITGKCDTCGSILLSNTTYRCPYIRCNSRLCIVCHNGGHTMLHCYKSTGDFHPAMNAVPVAPAVQIQPMYYPMQPLQMRDFLKGRGHSLKSLSHRKNG